MIHLEVTVAETSVLLDSHAYGPGALLCWEWSPNGTTWAQGGTIPLVSGTSSYDVWHPAGTATTEYRTRVSNAAGLVFSGYSAISPTGTGYATPTELALYLGTAAPADASRLLERATEVIREATRSNSDLAWDGLLSGISRVIPTEVAFWLEVGEEHDVDGHRGSLTSGKLSISQLPDRLALRALRALREVNLTSGSVAIG
jgi:hypothetical protein